MNLIYSNIFETAQAIKKLKLKAKVEEVDNETYDILVGTDLLFMRIHNRKILSINYNFDEYADEFTHSAANYILKNFII